MDQFLRQNGYRLDLPNIVEVGDLLVVVLTHSEAEALLFAMIGAASLPIDPDDVDQAKGL